MIQVPDMTLAASKIAAFEGFRAEPYRDSVGVPTIGYGTTRYPNGARVSMTDGPVSEIMAQAYLEHDMTDAAKHLAAALARQPGANQWAAMLSLAYNVGYPAIVNSTLVRKFNAGDVLGAAEQFEAWDKGHVDGQLVVIQGLLNRRRAERALFMLEA
jgi:lysozyme